MTLRLRSAQGGKGFTLPELLMAVMVAGMVVGGLAGISAMAARTQAREYRHGSVSNNLTLAMQYLTRDFAQASRIYTGGANSTTEISKTAANNLCLSWCDPSGTGGVGGAACLNPYAQLPTPTVSEPTYSFMYYCFKEELEPDGTPIGKLYRHTFTGAAATCTAQTCGSGSNPEVVAVYFDSMTVTRPSGATEFYRAIAGVQLNGHWYSASTGTDERVQLKTGFVLTSVYNGGP